MGSYRYRTRGIRNNRTLARIRTRTHTHSQHKGLFSSFFFAFSRIRIRANTAESIPFQRFSKKFLWYTSYKSQKVGKAKLFPYILSHIHIHIHIPVRIRGI